MLHTVLEKLKMLPAGKYLLSHSSKDVHLCIYRSTESRGTYNLQSDVLKQPGSHYEWLPLDTSLLLPHQLEPDQIPGTFPVYPDAPPKDTFNSQPNMSKRKKNKMKKKKTK
uniref:NMDA receptor-regulated protein 2-like n=1 Tax=Saccoglossus kowalevskii TaxID=10224 RepID=A0ABM0M232_SACKO|nr:PREDICTED: NMDA receptor-regulated protein 2-like [Saccoglossus kowalevskii]